MFIHRYVIVGHSIAGLKAAVTIRHCHPQAAITIVGDEGQYTYSRCRIPEVISGEVEPLSLRWEDEHFYRRHRLTTISGRVINIDPERHTVQLDGGRELHYDRLLIATGAEPVRPTRPGSDLTGVFVLRTLKDAISIARTAEAALSQPHGGRAVIVGGGLVGLKAAYALKKRGLREVTVVAASPHLLINQLDSEAAELVADHFLTLGINIITATNALDFVPDPQGRISAVTLSDGRELPADLVVVGRGVRPRTSLVAAAGGAVGKGIVVDSYLRTSLPDVYAAGDCCQIKDPLTGESRPSGLWVLAAEQGRYAGWNMSGYTAPYLPALMQRNAVRFGTLSVITAGIKTAESHSEQRRLPDGRPALRKFFYRNGRLVGYIMLNDFEDAGRFTAALAGQRQPGKG